MIILAFVFGAVAGVLLARRNNGNKWDQLQYAVVLGLIAVIVAMFGLVFIDRAM